MRRLKRRFKRKELQKKFASKSKKVFTLTDKERKQFSAAKSKVIKKLPKVVITKKKLKNLGKRVDFGRFF